MPKYKVGGTKKALKNAEMVFDEDGKPAWVFHKKYSYKEAEAVVKEYCEKGLPFNKTAIAGAMGVSLETVKRWMKSGGKYFNPEFCAIVDHYYPKAALKVTRELANAAYGNDKKRRDPKALSILASNMLGMCEKTERKQKVDQTVKMDVEFEDLSDSELEERIADIENKLENS